MAALPVVLTAAVVVFVAHCLYNRFRPGLRSIPGPWLAAYTKLWRLYLVIEGKGHLRSLELHRRHGAVVRIGPNHVSVGDPDYIPVFYGIKEDYTKSAFYPLNSITWHKQPVMNLFSTRDIHEHRAAKRKVAAAFAMHNVLQSEPAIDACLELFIARLGEFDGTDRAVVDLGTWLQYFAFDVIGEVNFARRFGFLEHGTDVDGIMQSIRGIVTYAALCGQVPELHGLLLGNPLIPYVTPALETWNRVLVFTLKAINSRAASLKRDGELISDEAAAADVEGHDMLSRWARVKASSPDKMTTRDIVSHLSANVLAGSDTTAIALRAIIYQLCRHPAARARMVDELDRADAAGQLATPVVSYRQASTLLPYTNAVIREAMRLHPPIGLIMERHVPPAGLAIHGHRLPAGTIVGINPWVANRDERLFPRPDAFVPERWLAQPAADDTPAQQQYRRKMDSAWEFIFGSGSRKCIGKSISWIEIVKVVPELYRRFDVSLAHPAREWLVCNHWFVQQRGLDCLLRRREGNTVAAPN